MPGPRHLGDEQGGDDVRSRPPEPGPASARTPIADERSRTAAARRRGVATPATPIRRPGPAGTQRRARQRSRAPAAASRATRARARRRASSRTTTSAGGQPELASPAACQRYETNRIEAAELRAASADADLEAAGEHEVRDPERDPEHQHGAERDAAVAQPVAPRHEHERAPGRRARAPRTDAPRRRAGSPLPTRPSRDGRRRAPASSSSSDAAERKRKRLYMRP